MSKRKMFRAMDELEEQAALEAMEEQQKDPILSTLDSFFTEGLITEVLHTVKSGKEATVFCCRAHPSQGVPYLAAKVYRSRNNRGFKNDAVYQEGRTITDQRASRAVKNKSSAGREMQFGMWVAHEFQTLTTLYQAGATIPRPIASNSNAIIMEYLGDQQEPAYALQGVELKEDEVYPVFELLMDNIQLWLKHDVIHGDLSPYNILYWQGKITIIDFPQAVDPRFNSHALSLLTRDIDNVCKYFARYGLKRDSSQLANRLWYQFRNARL
ncbi:serine/threonine protein kinase [Dictyobacter alpinus]|uniref:non-specific serine/threonine protein kinase n=1 Tax=Dictyobacter alpinus TaxID=2014873 RepID=A0A402B904_9CHLR|nr:RIO1 family regulatory kinase/ATPase [Dictyobacter alpinus]GCE27792.1 serine/threonine protein kinase [Dictyobacter alpinus]